jgi:enoyl-CoA hydratase/carnithine racemase
VVPDADLLDAARSLAERSAVNPPYAVRMAKRLLSGARQARLDTVPEPSASLQALAHVTGDHHEAVAAFARKRKPAFRKAGLQGGLAVVWPNRAAWPRKQRSASTWSVS